MVGTVVYDTKRLFDVLQPVLGERLFGVKVEGAVDGEIAPEIYLTESPTSAQRKEIFNVIKKASEEIFENSIKLYTAYLVDTEDPLHLQGIDLFNVPIKKPEVRK